MENVGAGGKVRLEHSHAIATDHDMQTWATTATKTTIAFHFSQAKLPTSPPLSPPPTGVLWYDFIYLPRSERERDQEREKERWKAAAWRSATRPGIVMRTVNKKLPPRQPTLEVVSLFALPSQRLGLLFLSTGKNLGGVSKFLRFSL